MLPRMCVISAVPDAWKRSCHVHNVPFKVLGIKSLPTPGEKGCFQGVESKQVKGQSCLSCNREDSEWCQKGHRCQ